MPYTPQEFAALIRSRYPAYAEVPDDVLVARTLEKYPVYRDQVAAAEAEPQPRPLGDIIRSSVSGLAKSGYNTFAGATQALAPAMETVGLGGQFPPLRSVPVEPEEEAAHTVGNIAQFFLPPLRAGGLAAQAVKAAGLSKAQGSGDAAAVASGALVALPGAAGSAARGLRGMAERQYSRALSATTEPMKAEAQRVVPQLLDQRVSGSLRQLRTRASGEAAQAGGQIRRTYEQAGKAGKLTDTDAIVQSLEAIKAPFYATTVQGAKIPANPAAIAKVDEVQEIFRQFGPKAPPDQVWKVRRVLDDLVGGGFGKDLSRGTAKDIQRQARTAIQKELSKVDPSIESLNATYALWRGLERVTTATLKRKEGQQNTVEIGLNVLAGGGLGALGGGVHGGAVGAALMGLMKSPRWRTVSAVQKARIADLLMRGEAKTLVAMLGRLGAGATSTTTQPANR